MPEFHIPPQYQDRIEVVEPHDQRTDEQILQSLLDQDVPVTSEKNVWAFWHSGLAAMPGWCQRNVIGWVRICCPEWTIRVLDNVPGSPNFALRYLDSSLLAQAFVDRTMDGPYAGQHGADLVRGAALTQHGGVWMDVGSILIRHLDRVCWDRIEDPQDPRQAAVAVQPSQGIMNYFVACHKGDPFIRRWHEVFCALWHGRTNLLGIADHPLVSFIKQIPAEQMDGAENGVGFDFKVPMIEVFEYAIQIVAWARLTMLGATPTDSFSPADYWLHHVMGMDAIAEAWRAETILGFAVGGQSKLDVLGTRLDADPSSEEYRRAEEVVWLILTESSMQKISRGKNMSVSVQLGTMLDLPENADKDHQPGTFADLLRYGAVHFRQTRSQITVRNPESRSAPLAKGHLEPF